MVIAESGQKRLCIEVAEVANDLLKGKEMPESWRSDLIPIYKKKKM